MAVTVSQTCERYQIPFISADNSSPSLHRRGLKFFFRAAAHDEMFSKAMFDFFDAMKKKGTKIETLALFHEDTIFGTDSGNAQTQAGRAAGLQDRLPTSNTAPTRRHCRPKFSRSRRRTPTC